MSCLSYRCPRRKSIATSVAPMLFHITYEFRYTNRVRTENGNA